MGIFVDYDDGLFSNLSSTPTTLVDTAMYLHPIYVQALYINNTGAQDIRINIRITQTQIAPPGVTSVVIIQDFLVPAAKQPREYKSTTLFGTVNLAKTLKFNKNLIYTANVSQKLEIYSNGYSEKFNCCIDFNVLKELPIV